MLVKGFDFIEFALILSLWYPWIASAKTTSHA